MSSLRNKNAPQGQKSTDANGAAINSGGFASLVLDDAPASVGAALVEQKIILERGDSASIGDVNAPGSDPIERLSVHHFDDADWQYEITVEQTVNLVNLVPESVVDKTKWLDDRSEIIRGFLRKEYRASELQTVDGDWERADVTFSVVHDGPVTEVEAYTIALEETKAVALYNEYDNGTWGSENLDRKLAEYCAGFAVSGIRGFEPGSMTDEDIDGETEDRMHHGREIENLTAVAIASSLASDQYPSLRWLAEWGFANKEEMGRELGQLYAAHEYRTGQNYRIRRRIDMLGTWALNSGA
jgi:hypothetical protein